MAFLTLSSVRRTAKVAGYAPIGATHGQIEFYMTTDRLQAAFWIALGLATLWLVSALSPILAPFLLAGTVAYICNPLVTQLSGGRLPRTWAVLLVMAVLAGIVVAFLLLLAPLFGEETRQLLNRLPDLLALVSDDLAPWIQQHVGIRLNVRVSSAELRQFLADNWGNLQSLAGRLIDSAATGGQALLRVVSVLLLTPVALFYLLRDWPRLTKSAEDLLPRPYHALAVEMAREVDALLAQFLRGQLLVMLLLATYYAAALALAGIDYALPLGLLTGLLAFVPYLGYASGLILALLVAALQIDGWGPVVGVLAVYGVGQLVESFVLTPLLVGERLGLHPLAVLFALLAFGQLFGFFGVLLALPAAAMLMVALRRMRVAYLASRFFTGAP